MTQRPATFSHSCLRDACCVGLYGTAHAEGRLWTTDVRVSASVIQPAGASDPQRISVQRSSSHGQGRQSCRLLDVSEAQRKTAIMDAK